VRVANVLDGLLRRGGIHDERRGEGEKEQRAHGGVTGKIDAEVWLGRRRLASDDVVP